VAIFPSPISTAHWCLFLDLLARRCDLGGPGTGTVTASGGSLTSNSVVLGAGTTDTKVIPGMTTDGTSQLTMGVAGTSTGAYKATGATSGTASIVAQAVAGTPTLTLPMQPGHSLLVRLRPIALSATTGALTWTGANIVTNGGSVVVGDIPYGTSTAATYNSLAAVAAGNVLVSNGWAAAPFWQKGLTGTTAADNAATGVVGEVQTCTVATGSSVTLTTATRRTSARSTRSPLETGTVPGLWTSLSARRPATRIS